LIDLWETNEKISHLSRKTSFYYSTCVIVAWLPVFQNEIYFKIIIESLNYCRLHKGLFLLGFVIMPSHVHLITSNTKETILSEIMRDFKTYTSRKIRRQLEKDKRTIYLHILENSAKNLPKQQYRLWTDDYHPIALKSEKWFRQQLEYMHNNPVRKGFVEQPEYWKYSNARN
jgi:putative transposase